MTYIRKEPANATTSTSSRGKILQPNSNIAQSSSQLACNRCRKSVDSERYFLDVENNDKPICFECVSARRAAREVAV